MTKKPNPFDAEYKKFLRLSELEDSETVRSAFCNGYAGGLNFTARLVLQEDMSQLDILDIVGKYTAIIMMYAMDPTGEEPISEEVKLVAAKHQLVMSLMRARDNAEPDSDAPPTAH